MPSWILKYFRRNLVNALTFLLLIPAAYYCGRMIVGSPGMSVSGWLFMMAPVALIVLAIVLITVSSQTGYSLAAFLSFSHAGIGRKLLSIILPVAAALSVSIAFDPLDLIVSAFLGIVIVLFLLSLHLLVKKQVIDAIGLILISLPLITYSEFQIRGVTRFSSEWITLKIAVILAFTFFWFISTFLIYRKNAVTSRFNKLILIFIGVTLLSAISSPDIPHSLSRWLFEVAYPIIFYFVVLNSIEDDSDIKRFMSYFIAGGFLNLTIVLYYFAKYGSWSSTLDVHLLTVAFADGMLIANVLLMIIPIVIAFMADADSNRDRLLLSLLLVLGFVGIAASFGRMVQISMALGLLAFVLNRRTRKYIVYIAAIIVLFLVFSSDEMIEPYLTKYQRISSFQDAVHVSSMEKRFVGWDAALGMFKEHPWTGVGIGRYHDEYANYGSQYYQAYAGGSVSMNTAHNFYLNYLAETGVQGFLILGIIFTLIVRKGFQLLKEGKQDHTFRFALLISVLVFLINNLVDGITFAYQNDIDKGMVFWSITAIIMSYDTVTKKNLRLSHAGLPGSRFTL